MLGMIADAISLRSFSSIWYWLAMAAFWFWALRHVMGVPVAMLRRGGSNDLDVLAHLQAGERARIWRRWQIWILACGGAGIALLTTLGFHYDNELAQALWFIALPYGLIQMIWLRLGLRILDVSARQDALVMQMHSAKNYVQVIVFAFIFTTVFNAFAHLLVNGFFW